MALMELQGKGGDYGTRQKEIILDRNSKLPLVFLENVIVNEEMFV